MRCALFYSQSKSRKVADDARFQEAVVLVDKRSVMKKLGIIAAMVSSLFCSCGKNDEEKIYTTDELGVIVEWGRIGWDEIYNETDASVTLIVSAYAGEDTSIINPGSFIMLDVGGFMPRISIDESYSVTIRLSDGKEIVCSRGAEDSWSKHFFSNFEQRQESEIVSLVDGKKVRHDLIVRTYHIDNTLVELWRASNPVAMARLATAAITSEI